MKKRTIVIICVCVVLIGSFIVLHNVMLNDDEDRIGYLEEPEEGFFNNYFSAYTGESISGSMVKVLIDRVISSNDYGDRRVKVEFKTILGLDDVLASSESSELKTIKDLLVNRQKYEVEFSEYSEDGFVSVITIKEI